jgi:asparagine synthase (glutamine-hydrolysing)
MCGIGAVFAYDARAPIVDRAELERTCDRMGCRGPDGEGRWFSEDGRVGLGHRRLAIIDLSARGAQPMVSADGSCVITFNGEIYNYRALRQGLEVEGVRFRSDSDTEVLLHLYARRGAAMVQELRGMFAFALWDARKGGLLLARDPFGIKPLYYATTGGVLRAASEVKALLAGGGVGRSPEPAGHVGFFLWGHVPEPYTLYRGIRAVAAGSTLWVDASGVASVQQHTHLDRLLSREAAPARADEVMPRLRDALLDTVRHHLVADVDVGVFLSAGLDSTTLAALAAEVGGGGRLRTITLGFEEFRGTEQDETPLAELVARQLGAEHQTVWITRADFQRELPSLLDRMDQPSTDGVNSYFVARAAAQAGLKVALSGLGGDELLGGYPSFREIPRLVGAVGRVPYAEAMGRGIRLATAPWLGRVTSPKYAGAVEYGGSYGGAYLLRRGLFMPWELSSVLDRDLVREGWSELDTLARLEATTAQLGDAHRKVSALEATWYMRNQLLRDADWASMTHSVEVRVPLVDWTLWGELAALGRVAPGVDKGAMARVPSMPLPDAVLRRGKTGFSVPTRQWLPERQGTPGRQRGLRGWARYLYERAGTS